MFQLGRIQNLNDYFKDLAARPEKGVYIYRLNGYSEEIKTFIKKYYDTARQCGVVLEGKIQNPTEQNLNFYYEMMGKEFRHDKAFFDQSLAKWLPRMSVSQRRVVAESMFDLLEKLRQGGRTENMLMNAYIKFMCWLYYKFERVVNQLGANNVPKILYEGEVSNYEWMLMKLLAGAGCDVVLLQYQGDEGYRKLDPESVQSYEYVVPGLQAFPQNFSLKQLRDEARVASVAAPVMQSGGMTACTNAWIKGEGLEDFKTPIQARGEDENLFYNCFVRMNGVEDKITYMDQLYHFQLDLKNNKRHLVIVDQKIPMASMEEIAEIRRENGYTDVVQMIKSLCKNMQNIANPKLQQIMGDAFAKVMLEESKQPQMNLNRLLNKGVMLLCLAKRYQKQLLPSWKPGEIGVFIYMGGCQDENEALFLRFLSRTPVDVLILVPNRNQKCVLEDSMLYEINYEESLTMGKFPQQNTGLHIGTSAFHAERELDSLMYQNSGIYRNQQYEKANIITLQTMAEEIGILWDEELKYRPSFSTVQEVVNLPVVFAKMSGVKDGNVAAYWSSIKTLMTEDSFHIINPPLITQTSPNPMKACATSFFKNGKLNKRAIKSHPEYKYGFLREEIQEHMLDKLAMLVEDKVIRGIGENGTEYSVIAIALNLDISMLRKIQKFDFTKKNPKMIYINTRESGTTLEDAILLAYLNAIGFDVVCFIPTGYQSIEKYYNKHLMEEHQNGEYIYDLEVPNFNTISSNTRQSWRDKIFKRGT